MAKVRVTLNPMNYQKWIGSLFRDYFWNPFESSHSENCYYSVQ